MTLPMFDLALDGYCMSKGIQRKKLMSKNEALTMLGK